MLNKLRTSLRKQPWYAGLNQIRSLDIYEEIGEEYISETAEAVKAIKEKYHFTDLNGDAECNVCMRTENIFMDRKKGITNNAHEGVSEEVKVVQAMLRNAGYYRTEDDEYRPIDGKFGDNTKEAVKAYQRDKEGLEENENGYLDKATREKLEEEWENNLSGWGLPVDDGKTVRTNDYYVGEFGARYIYHHTGIDILGDVGDSIYAAKDGTVILAQKIDALGKVVYIKHDDGITSRYAHLSEMSVEKGDEVEKEAEIGKMGRTGFDDDNNDQRGAGDEPTHLHFEIREPKEQSMNDNDYVKNKKNDFINPAIYVSELDDLTRENNE